MDQQSGSDTEKQSAPNNLSELLDHFVNSTQSQDEVKVDDLLQSLSSRSHGPMLLFPAILAISPVGMIPGMSFVTGTLIILIGTQMLFFSSRPWIPKVIANYSFSRDKLTSGVSKSKPWVEWFEKAVHHRFEFMAEGIMIYPVAILSVLLALSFYPLALVPMGVFVPGFAIALFALGLTARDGLLILIGYVFAIATAVVAWNYWPV
jgi:hypothetical protein